MINFLSKFFPIQVGATGIIVKDGKILLTKRSRFLVDGGMWCLPGGHIKKMEKAKDSIVREVKEEIGLDIVKSKLLFVHEEFVNRIGLHAIVFVFKLDVNGKIKNNWEVSESKFSSKPEIKDLKIAFSHREIIERFFKEFKNEN